MPAFTGFVRSLSLVLALSFCFSIIPAPRQSHAEQLLGEIRWVAFNFAPQGWALCNGSTLNINQNSALFSLLGTTYGGNGTTTFALPDMRGRSPIGDDAAHPQGSSVGQEQATLLNTNLPLHTHPVLASYNAGNSASPTNAVWALSPEGNQLYKSSGIPAAMGSSMVGSSGNGQAFSVMQPYAVLNCIIATAGIYPSRP